MKINTYIAIVTEGRVNWTLHHQQEMVDYGSDDTLDEPLRAAHSRGLHPQAVIEIFPDSTPRYVLHAITPDGEFLFDATEGDTLSVIHHPDGSATLTVHE